MKLLAVIPARGGSKGVPRKNLRPLAGRPLIAWTIEAALAARSIDRLIVSTDDEEIALVARANGAEVIRRPAELAADGSPTLFALQHVVQQLHAEGYYADAVVTLQPTSPLRQARHIDEAIAIFEADPRADSLVSCIEVPHIFHPMSVMRRTEGGYLEPYLSAPQPTRRQDKETIFARNGAAIYITRTPQLAEYVFGGRVLPYPMDATTSVDIDTLEDLETAERLLQTRQ